MNSIVTLVSIEDFSDVIKLKTRPHFEQIAFLTDSSYVYIEPILFTSFCSATGSERRQSLDYCDRMPGLTRAWVHAGWRSPDSDFRSYLYLEKRLSQWDIKRLGAKPTLQVDLDDGFFIELTLISKLCEPEDNNIVITLRNKTPVTLQTEHLLSFCQSSGV
ncbi:hypothetical protein RRG08_008732 [Elysia crispata]|uniref:Uncharacterized protein n=1 Tax=Elysia crispata TaxID=231223 RepID=A0AAE0XQ68_9GAST|nr:hypothetical protein RRG08_008732 [Elysia crispata]